MRDHPITSRCESGKPKSRGQPSVGWYEIRYKLDNIMMRHFALALFAASFLASCESNAPYEPVNRPEQIEFKRARLEVYPDDVRRDVDHYANTPVAWVGVIRSTDAQEDDYGGGITAETVFEHHYFDWEQDKDPSGVNLMVSPRGEGSFTCNWQLRKMASDASAYDAEKFAHNGKLAIVYGVPESVKPDGTIVLKYTYLRILGRAHFSTNYIDYGRLGEELYKPMGDNLKPSAQNSAGQPPLSYQWQFDGTALKATAQNTAGR